MSRLLAKLAPVRDLIVRRLNGDHEVTTFDTSYWREGALWACPINAPLYVLAGNQLVMHYFSHNVAISEDGIFAGRDDAGGCMILTYGEDELWRWFAAPSAAKGTLPVWTQFKSFAALTGAEIWVGPMTPSQTAGIVGTTAVNNANAGSVGEFLVVGTTAPNTTALTTTVANNATSGSITAGDWDVWGSVNFTPAVATSITVLAGGISSTTATLPAQDLYFEDSFSANVPGTTVIITKPVPIGRFNVGGTTTIFLAVRATFTLGALGVGGTIWARRRR